MKKCSKLTANTNQPVTAANKLFDEVLLNFANTNLPAVKPDFSKDIKLTTPPDEIKRVYINQINYLKGILENKGIKDEAIKNLEAMTSGLSLLAIVLPIVMTALSGVLVFLTQNWLTALVNLANAVPPFLVNMYKTKTENWYKGASYKFSLKMLEAYINRIDTFTDDILRNLDSKLQDLGDKITQLGSA